MISDKERADSLIFIENFYNQLNIYKNKTFILGKFLQVKIKNIDITPFILECINETATKWNLIVIDIDNINNDSIIKFFNKDYIEKNLSDTDINNYFN